MRPEQRTNLKRLLSPRHIAVIGGRDAEIVIRECRRIGFKGSIWAVNPNRESLEGIACAASVRDLPEPPDAVFLAVPPAAALETVAELAAIGAGGIVCFTAGFGEDGKEGGTSDLPLVDAAADMAVVGPNCYGLINYLDRVALWPFEHGGDCPGYGAAIVTQSGMLSSDITMNQRSVPLAFMISAGNQSLLRLEDYLDVLCEYDAVRAIGLHVEGIKDITAFCRAALKAMEKGKPVVVMKTGKSKIGSDLTVSHTGSLSGAYDCYKALFKRLGMLEVDHPAQMLETLKFLTLSGVPSGNRVMAFTCSGGGATMVADYADKIDLQLNAVSPNTTAELQSLLPAIATVSNPLDYTTPIWGQPDKTLPVFSSALSDPHDIALLVQDYPLPEIDDSKHFYLSDALAFAQAAASADVPHAVCSTLPENMDKNTRDTLIQRGVTPLQGISDGLDAIQAAVSYGQLGKRSYDHATRIVNTPAVATTIACTENSIKEMLRSAGLNVPGSRVVSVTASAAELQSAAATLALPWVLKFVSPVVQHKTEVGAVVLGIDSVEALMFAASKMKSRLEAQALLRADDKFLLETQSPKPVAELLFSIRTDEQFGLVLTLGSGGTLVELVADTQTLILPVTERELGDALNSLKVSRILEGHRGAPPVNRQSLLTALWQIIEFVEDRSDSIVELEINPLFVYHDEVVIIDALAQFRTSAD